jgi:hypothetical protein
MFSLHEYRNNPTPYKLKDPLHFLQLPCFYIWTPYQASLRYAYKVGRSYPAGIFVSPERIGSVRPNYTFVLGPFFLKVSQYALIIKRHRLRIRRKRISSLGCTSTTGEDVNKLSTGFQTWTPILWKFCGFGPNIF